MNAVALVTGSDRPGILGRLFENVILFSLFLLFRTTTVVLGYRVDGRCGGDGRLLLLPGEQEQQDHGVVQEHGAAVRRGGARRP